MMELFVLISLCNGWKSLHLFAESQNKMQQANLIRPKKTMLTCRGALAWTSLSADDINLDFEEFKSLKKKHVKLSI